MSVSRRDQFADWVIAVATVGFTAFILLSPGKVLLAPPANDVGHPAIKQSANWCLFLWCSAWPAALLARVAVRKGDNLLAFRFAWALGCALLLWHIAIAFHVGHDWSHQAAWNHTRQVG